MTWRHYAGLFILSLVVLAGAAVFQQTPGYMDADYYYAGGLQLWRGNGFSEPYLWNYLDDPQGLPHASHAYWMPLASLLSAAGCFLFRSGTWWAGRSLFLLTAALVPPVTAALAWQLTGKRGLAVLSGCLAVFSGFFLPFMGVTDTFSLNMLLGGIFFLILAGKERSWHPFILGLLAGFFHLARADGILWLAIALLAAAFRNSQPTRRLGILRYSSLLVVLAGYVLIMLPWFLRNQAAFGSFLAPGGTRMFWLTSYDRLFAYPGDKLTLETWLQSGWNAILYSLLTALGMNLATAVSVQGSIFLFPLIVAGSIKFRRHIVVRLAAAGWLATLAVMTVFFPFAGSRGGFFHSGAAFQPLWWALVPTGLESLVVWAARQRGWNLEDALKVFRFSLIVAVALLSGTILSMRVLGWGGGEKWGMDIIAYRQAALFLDDLGMKDDTVVMVANPPGFYLASGNPAIAVPDEGPLTVLEAARFFQAQYLILEPGATPGELIPIYEAAPVQSFLLYLGEVGGMRIYDLTP